MFPLKMPLSRNWINRDLGLITVIYVFKRPTFMYHFSEIFFIDFHIEYNISKNPEGSEGNIQYILLT